MWHGLGVRSLGHIDYRSHCQDGSIEIQKLCSYIAMISLPSLHGLVFKINFRRLSLSEELLTMPQQLTESE